MQKTPFRVLFREFLFRTVDLELLTPKGDTSKLLGQIAALLIFASIAFAFPALGLGSARNLPAPFVLFVTYSGEHFMIATTMLVTGLLAVLSWDSTSRTSATCSFSCPCRYQPVRCSWRKCRRWL